MSETMYAPCGLDCAHCDMYLATQADDDEMRLAIAEKWTALFHYAFQKDEINCDGCLSGGKMSLYCMNMCQIKPCATAKGLVSCRDCPDYACDKLKQNQEDSAQYVP